MRNTRIYSPQTLNIGSSVTLDGNASHHLLKVLRAKPGISVTLFNGNGGEFQGILCESSTKKRAVIKLEHFENINRESPLSLIHI